MTTAIPGVRAHIATALAGLGVNVYTYPDSQPLQPPCVALLPGSPYRDPGTAWDSSTVNIDVRLIVSDGADLFPTQTMDALIDAVVAALDAVQVQVGSIPAPTPEPEQAAITCDIPTSTIWKDE